MEFKDWLKKLRKINGMTQEELSKKSGLAIGTIRQYEAGKRRPEYEALMKLLNAFDLTDAEMLRGLQSSTTQQGIKKEPTPESGLAEKLQRLSPELFEKFSQFLELAIENPESAERFLSFAVQALQSSQSSH